ncbi:MAG: hypothetical protein IPK19_00905 [Chloroflexi bacterium]|nr:hypothetical protein [Chloroflexota bacterium]
MTPGAEDRLALLLNQTTVTGIDFVYVYPSQDRLDVYFLLDPALMDAPLIGTVNADQIAIENLRDEDQPDVTITNLAWAVEDGRNVLRLDVVRPISFAPHKLTLDDPARIDPYYKSKVFSFQANCDTGLDCEPDEPLPYPEEYVDFPVDYTARDFLSFRQALFDFASQRYPRWLDRLEADVGVMLLEVLSAVGDEMAYAQDRISREATLETATQRRSLRLLARLVDYDLSDGRAGTTWLDVTVEPGMAGAIPTGTPVTSADGSVSYEVGTGLFDPAAGYDVEFVLNSFTPYFWDEDDLTLPAGSTELYLAGDHLAALTPPEDRLLLIKTDPPDPSDPAQRLLVHLQAVETLQDPLTGDDVTRIAWDTPTSYDMDKRFLEVRGNILPVTAGSTRTLVFTIADSGDPFGSPSAIARLGGGAPPRDTPPIYRFSLPETDFLGLSWLYASELGRLRPEIRLYGAALVGDTYVRQPNDEWLWRSSLVGVASSNPFSADFTLEDGTWGRVIGYPVPGDEYVHRDYASPLGYTLRFGDGEFGMIPSSRGAFVVDYRVNTGGTAADNIPRGTLTRLGVGLPFVRAVINPIAATDALPAESLESARINAPEAYKAITYRAVRPEDYAEAAERLDWVQQAGASMRWTGSWRTIFAAADPMNALTIAAEQSTALDRQLDRFRQAGQDAQQRPPRYADIDLKITVCAENFAYAGEVKEAVLIALMGDPRTGQTGFFSPDRFSFGSPLYRGALEAAAQAAYGVRAVESIEFRRRGFFQWRLFTQAESFYDPGIDTIIRVANDPLYPEHGTVRVTVKGGA